MCFFGGVVIKRFLFILLQCIWGFPQTLLGFLLFLWQIRSPHRMFRGTVVTIWQFRGSASMGMFLFIGKWDADDQYLLTHEYGHSLQSLALGPLYLPAAAVPSVLWFWLFRKYRRAHHIPYRRFYTEQWADAWGAAFSKEPE